MALAQIYDELAFDYDEKYVYGDNNPYMYDEYAAAAYYKKQNFNGKIISLGCGTGQDVSILDHPHPNNFIGYDISEGMLSKARIKHPEYQFILHDCNKMTGNKGDILVSMFGTPNYIGAGKLWEHYKNIEANHAFFIFYNENYNDGVIKDYYQYSAGQLEEIFIGADLYNLNENYYVVTW